MAIARDVAPIKVGLLLDLVIPPPSGWDNRQDLLDTIELVFNDAAACGRIDRPIDLVLREVEGLPRGTVKAVIDAYAELVDEGCLIIIGPLGSENAVPTRDEIERRFRVPSLSVCGTDAFLGEWTFALSNGSLTDEPYVLADVIARAGHRSVGVSVERSLTGTEYLRSFRDACRIEDVAIVAEAPIAQSGVDATGVVRALFDAEPDAIVHWGFGFGVVRINEALSALRWDPPRYMGTAFENGYINDELMRANVGWIGLEQYDESNPVGQALLDRFEAVYGRRPQYYLPMMARDVAETVVQALERAEPLSPRGLKESLERVKMVPAACGSSGTRISFGQWTRRGWMGAGYLVARSVDPDDFMKTTLRARYAQG